MAKQVDRIDTGAMATGSQKDVEQSGTEENWIKSPKVSYKEGTSSSILQCRRVAWIYGNLLRFIKNERWGWHDGMVG